MPSYFSRSLVALLIGLAAAPALAAPSAEPAYEVEYTNETPLMVIRFNQRRVPYERPLYNVVSQALKTKPSATFDVVSIAPKAADSAGQARFVQMADSNTQRVLATLTSMGLPKSRVNLTQATDAVASSEVRIFVH